MLIDLAKKNPLFSGKKPTETTESGIPWKVLVVDDEPDVHTVTKLALSALNSMAAPSPLSMPTVLNKQKSYSIKNVISPSPLLML